MKKRFLFISAFLLLALSSCMNETLQPESSMELKVSVSLAAVQTKTYLGEVDGNTRKVYWSEGDAVSMNGFASDVLSAEQAGNATADFKFYNGDLPYRVVYPASICKEFTPDGKVTVDVPATQEYSSDTFGKGAAILYGYSETEDSPVVLNNLCGAVKVTLKSEAGTAIKRAVLISNDKTVPVAGTFVIDPQTGAYTISEGIKSISLNIDQVTVDANGKQSFYFTVPYGSYPEGFTVKFYDSDSRPMECSWLRDKNSAEAGVTIAAGKLYEFNPVDFVPGKKEILTGEDWKYIAEQINQSKNDWKATYLSDDNTIKLGDDVVLPEDTPQITNSFPYILDGKGYTITNNNATASLIKTLPANGAIRNLTIAGTMRSSSETANVELAAFVHTVSGGSIEDCTNEMEFDVKAKKVVFGAFARTLKAGEITRCVNNANMKISMDVSSYVGSESSSDLKSFGGGIVATCFEPTEVVRLNDCVNNGNLNITVKTGGVGLARAGFAGVLGYISLKSESCYPILKNCTNNGDVTFSFEDSSSKNAQYSVGGLVGLSAALNTTASASSPRIDFKYGGISTTTNHYHVEIENCTNTGRINNNATSNNAPAAEINTKVYTGGIAGTLLGSSSNHAVVKNCTNTGDVVPYSVKVNPYSRASICGVSGGFLGLGGYVDVEGGVMNAKVGSAISRSFATAGVIGMAIYKFSIKDMSVNANISMIQSTDKYTKDNHALAVTNNTAVVNSDLAGSEIKGCQFAGSFLLSCSGVYNAAPVIPTEITHVTADDFPGGTNVVSKSYTKANIAMENNTYWSNVNGQ